MFIRMVNEADAKQLINIYKPYVETNVISFEYETPSIETFKQRIRGTKEKYPYLVAVEKETVLGYAYAHDYNDREAYQWTVEISIYLSKSAQGKGIGQKLYESLENYLMRQNVVNLMVCITETNLNSLAFHQHLGYEIVGQFKKVGFKSNKWLDIYWLQKQLYTLNKPHKFIPFSKLNKD